MKVSVRPRPMDERGGLLPSMGRNAYGAVLGAYQRTVGDMSGARGSVSPRPFRAIRSRGHPAPASVPLRERL